MTGPHVSIFFLKKINNIVCYYHITYAFQSESTLHSCLKVRELLALNRRKIWSLSDCKWTRTHNHLVSKRTLSHLVKLVKWFSCVVSTYLHGALNCMLSSCHVHISEWTTLYSCLNLKELLAQNRSEIWSFRLQLQSLKLQISSLFWARSSLTFRQL